MPFIIGSDINFMDDQGNIKNLINELIKQAPTSGLKASLPALSKNTFYYCTDTGELFFGTTQGNKLIGGSPAITDTIPPNEVSNLQASNITTTSLILLWDASTSSDVVRYDIYQDTTLLGNTTQVSYSVTGLTESTAYTFKIVAIDSNGNSSTGMILNVTTGASNVSVTGVSLNNTTYTMNTNSSLLLKATVTPSNATNQTVTWSSSDPSIATVDYTGLVNAVTQGTVTITVTTQDGGFTTTCILTIASAIQGFDYNNLVAYPNTSKIQMDQAVTSQSTGDTGAGDWVHPSVLYFDTPWNGHQWWMGISPYPNTQGSFENTYFFYSDDGDNWVTPAGVTGTIFPLKSGFGNNSDPNLFMDLDGNTMHILNRAVYGTTPPSTWSTGSVIEIISTTDGINFSDRVTIFDTGNTGYDLVAPSVCVYGGKYYMFAIDPADQTHLTVLESSDPKATFTEINRISTGTLGDLWHPEVRYINGEFIVIANDGGAQGGSLMLGKFQTPNDTVIIGRNNYFMNATGTGNARIYKSSLVYKSDTDIEIFLGTKGGTLDSNCEWWVTRTPVQRLDQTLDLSSYTQTQTVVSLNGSKSTTNKLIPEYSKYAVQYTIDDLSSVAVAFADQYLTSIDVKLLMGTDGQSLLTELWGIANADGQGGSSVDDFVSYGIKVGDEITQIMTKAGDVEYYINGRLIRTYPNKFNSYKGYKYFGVLNKGALTVSNVKIYVLPEYLSSTQKIMDFETQLSTEYSTTPTDFILYDQFNRSDSTTVSPSDNGVNYTVVGTPEIVGNKLDVDGTADVILVPYTGDIQIVFSKAQQYFGLYLQYTDANNYVKLRAPDAVGGSTRRIIDVCTNGTVTQNNYESYSSMTDVEVTQFRIDIISNIAYIYENTIPCGTFDLSGYVFGKNVGLTGHFNNTEYDYFIVKQL